MEGKMYVPILIIRLVQVAMLILILILLVVLLDMILKKYKKKTIIIGNSQKKGKRPVQEDSFSTFETDNGLIAIVADGMGGLEHGKIASQTTVKLFTEEYTKEYELYDAQRFLINSAYKANDRILDMASGRKIGTTLIATIIKENFFHWVSVGDSRIYLHRKGKLMKLNKEHTYKEELHKLYEKGKISRKDVHSHPQKEFLTSYIGYEDFHELDYSKTPICLNRGDKIILMSDGIYKSIEEEEIKHVLNKKCCPDTKCQLITDIIESKNLSHQDNMTVIIVERK